MMTRMIATMAPAWIVMLTLILVIRWGCLLSLSIRRPPKLEERVECGFFECDGLDDNFTAGTEVVGHLHVAVYIAAIV